MYVCKCLFMSKRTLLTSLQYPYVYLLLCYTLTLTHTLPPCLCLVISFSVCLFFFNYLFLHFRFRRSVFLFHTCNYDNGHYGLCPRPMLPCAWCHPLTLISATGLRSGVFRDIPFIQEVECSGAGLDSDTNLLSASLYRLSDNAILASLNMGTKECTTSSSFSSCEIRDTDSRKSRVRTLVMNLSSGESLRFGCEVSSIRAGERVKVNSWFLTLTGASSEYTQFSPKVLLIQKLVCD